MEAGQEPGKNQLDPQQDVRLLGEPIREEKDEEGRAAPEDELARARMANQSPPRKQPHGNHKRQLDQKKWEGSPRSVDDARLQQDGGQPQALDGIGLRATPEVEQQRVRDEGAG